MVQEVQANPSSRIISWTLSEGSIALAVAGSGVARLLHGGRTAHSRFKLPLNPREDSTCAISRQSSLSELLRQTRLIVLDNQLLQQAYATSHANDGQFLGHRMPHAALDKESTDIITVDAQIAVFHLPVKVTWTNLGPYGNWSPDSRIPPPGNRIVERLTQTGVSDRIDLQSIENLEHAVSRYKRTSDLRHIFIDEAHLLLGHAKFRQLLSVKLLKRLNVPVFLLTATLPSAQESQLVDKLMMSRDASLRDPIQVDFFRQYQI